MENNPRDHLSIEGEFCQANNIIAVMADLLTAVDQGKIELADGTLEKLGFSCFVEAEKTKALFYEIIQLYLSNRPDSSQTPASEIDSSDSYQAGVLKGRKESWEVVHALIADKDNRQGNGMDKVAETNGLVLASSAIFEMINSPTPQ